MNKSILDDYSPQQLQLLKNLWRLSSFTEVCNELDLSPRRVLEVAGALGLTGPGVAPAASLDVEGCQRSTRPHGRSRVSGRAVGWLSMLAMIAQESVNSRHIRERLGCNRSTITRYLQDVEQIYGVVVDYVRQSGGGGWYEIRDWGVLSPDQVLEKYSGSETNTNPARSW